MKKVKLFKNKTSTLLWQHPKTHITYLAWLLQKLPCTGPLFTKHIYNKCIFSDKLRFNNTDVLTTQEYIPDRYHDYLNNVIPSAWNFKSHLTVSSSRVNQYTATAYCFTPNATRPTDGSLLYSQYSHTKALYYHKSTQVTRTLTLQTCVPGDLFRTSTGLLDIVSSTRAVGQCLQTGHDSKVRVHPS